MAKIVTITNPLTGQPAQVDQLEHTAQQIDDATARALEGGAIDQLLAGKAPAGYGLGGGTTIPTTNDADSCTDTGWYAISSMSNCPFTYGLLRVEKWYDECIFQTAYEMSSGNVVQRRKRNSEWKPWEYVNPPMQLGEEYRTTERYKGKPVYIKAVDTGALPNATFKSVAASFPNANAIVDYGGEAYQDGDHFIPLPCLKYGVDSYNNEKGVQVTISNGYGITIATMTDFSSFKSSSVWVKYTKSTD